MNDINTLDVEMLGQGISFKNILNWALVLLKSPTKFFSQLPKAGGYGTPVVYALFWFFLATGVEIVISHFRQPVKVGWAMELAWLFLGPLLLVGVGFIGAAIFFVIWHLMGSKENYQTAFRCWAFTTPVSLASAILSLVPFLNLLAFLYATYLLVMASIYTHGIPSRRSWTVWGIFCGVLLVMVGGSFAARKYLEGRGINFDQPGFGGTSFSEDGLSNENLLEDEFTDTEVEETVVAEKDAAVSTDSTDLLKAPANEGSGK